MVNLFLKHRRVGFHCWCKFKPLSPIHGLEINIKLAFGKMVTRIWKILDLVLFLFGKAIRAVFGDTLIFPFAFEVGLSFLVPFKVR